MASASTCRTDIFSIFKHRYLRDLPEAEVLNQLETVIKKDPDSVFARNGFGQTSLHAAAVKLSPNVCKMLIEADPSLRNVRATDHYENLPFHSAILARNLETVKYLFEVYPESINTPAWLGLYPMHLVAGSAKFDAAQEKIFHFLLKNDQGAVTAADDFGKLPLHWACKDKFTQPIVKHLFDAYPGAIHISDKEGLTPLEQARLNNLSETVSFFEYQLNAVENIPLHEALGNPDVSLGAIKLVIEANPQSLSAADSQGQLPLHIACGICGIDIVKCLVEAYPNALQAHNANNNLPLHIACREGNFDVINYILEVSDHGVGMKDGERMLPINLLLLCADCDRDCMEYVDSVGRLLRLNPTSLISNMVL